MRDKVLEMRIEELQELIDLWDKFHEMVVAVIKGADFGEEHNRDFLSVKSSVARKFQAIADKFERKTFPEEEITDVLAQAVSLEQIKNMTNFTSSQLENTWHRVYITLSKILGHLESEKDALARVSSFGFGIKRLMRNKLFIFLVIVGILFGGAFMAYRAIMPLLLPPAEEGEEAAEEPQTELEVLIAKITELVDSIKQRVEESELEGEEGEVSVYRVNRWYSLIWGLIGAVACGWLAYSKGKHPVLWGLFGFLCCPVTFIVLLIKG